MLFYTAESPGTDFPIAELDREASVLWSPTSFHPQYQYPFRLPERVVIDSGAYVHGTSKTHRGRFRTLMEQLRIAEQVPKASVTITHCDVLMREQQEARSAVDTTLRNAEWFMAQDVVPSHLQRMLVAQARDPDEVYLVVSQLQDLGPDLIALGGLAKFVRNGRTLLPQMIEAAVEGARETPIHILGITASHLLERLDRLGIQQCDSATAAWAAVYGNVLYSRPYRRYRLASQHSNQPQARQESSFARTITAPLPCPCPVCQAEQDHLAGITVRAKFLRFIHNYYHLKLEVQGEGPWQEAYLLAEYQSVITTLLSSRKSSDTPGKSVSETLPSR